MLGVFAVRRMPHWQKLNPKNKEITLKHYLGIAKQYFLDMEGLQLYPSYRTLWFWAWLATTGLWLTSFIYFLATQQPLLGQNIHVSVLVPEALWLVVVMCISKWKERELISAANRRFETSFSSVTECRRFLLSSAVAVAPYDFLKTATEIEDLLALQRKFRKYSDLTSSDLWSKIYDRDSKARLLALIIALVTMTVALSVRSSATLETLFDVYSEPGNRQFMAFVAGMATLMFVVFVGLQILTLSIVDGLALWAIKLSRGSMFSGWLLSYLVRDLVLYHGLSFTKAPMSISPNATNDGAEGRAALNESNVVKFTATSP